MCGIQHQGGVSAWKRTEEEEEEEVSEEKTFGPRPVRQPDFGMSGGNALQASRTVHAKALRWEQGQCPGGAAGRPKCWSG